MDSHHFPPYDFDSGSLQLWKHGRRVKLQRKPALILAALLEHPGQPILRKDLYLRLWPADTYVDFDLSLNVAVKKLRDSLDDSAEEPMFIETLSGVGYRFIGPISSPLTSPIVEPHAIAMDMKEPPATFEECVIPKTQSRTSWKIAIAGFLVFALVGVVLALVLSSGRPLARPSASMTMDFGQCSADV